eukprot:CAMPEP_0181353312 /NCGR_PEP_ID=MMETSP1106-20121128/2769_1 /TAXON_ID=81844 /ORGANISM="Mantoniella antarctica, Strain SL-175" /LENGTH=87 /DNA_ID=CAMNT_0023465917 /DNA_START=181 /DNA_END=444 /DNA_ORIENTATION=-
MPPKHKRLPPRRGPTRRLSRTARVECHEHTCTCEPAVTDRTCGTARAIKHVWNALPCPRRNGVCDATSMIAELFGCTSMLPGLGFRV